MLTIDLFLWFLIMPLWALSLTQKGVVIEKLIDETFLAFLQTAWGIRAFVPTVADDSLVNVPTPQMSPIVLAHISLVVYVALTER